MTRDFETEMPSYRRSFRDLESRIWLADITEVADHESVRQDMPPRYQSHVSQPLAAYGSRFKIQDSRMVYCNFNRNLHGIHSKIEAQVGLFVLNTIKSNCITLTSLVQQVSKVQGGVVPVIHVLYRVRVNNNDNTKSLTHWGLYTMLSILIVWQNLSKSLDNLVNSWFK